MDRRFLANSVALVLGAAISAGAEEELPYPSAVRGSHVDEYHGVRVSDPYRWMEDIDSPRTRAWVQAEGNLSAKYLAAIPGRAAIRRRLAKIWQFERWGVPQRHAGHWFYTHTDGVQNQPVIFVTADLKSAGRPLLDPNLLSKDGTLALNEYAICDDGSLLAYALSDAGSDWQTWHVRDVMSGRDLSDELRWSKAAGAAWRKDCSGFYYTAFDPPAPGEALKAVNQYEKLYFHSLHRPQSEDRLIYARSDDPDSFIYAAVTDDGRYLVLHVHHGDEVQNTVLIQDLSVSNAPIVPIIETPRAAYEIIGNLGTTFFALTDDAAPRYRIVAFDLAVHPHKWRTIVPEGADTLESGSLVGGELIAQYLKDAHSAVRRFTTEGKLIGEVALEGLGTTRGFDGRPDDQETYYSYSSFTAPPSVYRLSLQDGSVSLWRRSQPHGFDSAAYETRQVFYASKDGTQVPMFIAARRGIQLDGSHPTILYGYGGFNSSRVPAFTPAVAGWLAMGGVYALANLRGGGEYGRAWHEAGMKTHKQNVFDDFIAAAEFLISQHWTKPAQLAIQAASNGGLLVGATLEQRPELFAAAVPQVGVLDMLRFRNFTVGKGWEADYGSTDNPEEFRALLAYSPVHNAKPGVDYPAVLVTTGDHDDRVFPAHSFKFTAALQNADPHGKPILLRIATRAGHGGGKPTAKQIAEGTDIYAFVLNAMGRNAH